MGVVSSDMNDLGRKQYYVRYAVHEFYDTDDRSKITHFLKERQIDKVLDHTPQRENEDRPRTCDTGLEL